VKASGYKFDPSNCWGNHLLVEAFEAKKSLFVRRQHEIKNNSESGLKRDEEK
jgi:hypothetical protein